MNTDNGSLAFDFYLNNTRLQQTSAEAERRIKGVTDTAIAEGKRAESSFNGLSTALATIGGTAFATMIGNKILNVTGEFQQLDVAFTTMLGSKEKAERLMGQIIETAATTPFSLTEVAQGAKQLLAYQVAAEEVNDTVTRLGNISAGVSVPLSRLILVYGQVKAKGRLMGDDLRQFTEAGIPIIHELAKSMGVADNEISKMVENGKIGFPEVQKVIQNLTNEGGMFFNLMEKQSLTITGQISNLGDALDVMFNSIGQSNEGIISSSISGLTTLVENYEVLEDILIGLVATYGAYKAAVIVTNAVSALQTEIAFQQILANIGNTGTTIQLTTAEGIAAVAKSRLTAAQLALNKSMLANPYVLAATALVALAVVIYNVAEAQTQAEIAQKRYKDAIDKTNVAIDEEKSKSSTLLQIINDEGNSREFRNKKLDEFIKLNPAILQGLTLETLKTKEGKDAIDQYIKSLEKRIKMQTLEAELTESIKRSQAATRGDENLDLTDKVTAFLGSAISNNPLSEQTSRAISSAKNNKAVIDAEKDLQRKLKEELNSITNSNQNTGKDVANVIINADYWEDQVKSAKESLDKLDTNSKTYAVQRKKLLADIAKGESEIEKIRGKKVKDTSKKDNSDFESARKELLKKAMTEENQIIRKGIEDRIQLNEFELRQQDLTYQKEQDLLKQNIAIKKELIDFDLKQTLKAIDDEQIEFVKKAKKAGVSNPNLSGFTSLRNSANTKATSDTAALTLFDTEAERQKLNDLLSNYKDVSQQLLAVETSYNRDMQRLTISLYAAKTEAEKEQIQKSMAEREKQFKEAKSQISIDELMESPDWKKLFGNLSSISVRELLKLKNLIEDNFDKMDLTPSDLKALRDKIKEATEEIERRNPFLALSEALKKYKQDSSSVNFKEVASAAGASIDGVKDVFDTAVSSLDKLGIKTSEETDKILEDVSGMLEGASSIAKGIATGDPFAIVKGSIQFIANGIDLIAGGKDRKLEKSIRRHKEEVDRLKLAYEQLQRAIDKALGSDRYSSQKATIDNLKKQQLEYAAMAQSERDKKKTDNEKVKEYEAAIISSGNAIEDVVTKLREDILGMDVSSVANDLGSAIIDAFAAGENAAEAWGNKVNDIVGDVIKKMLVQKLVEEPVGNIINKYMAKWVDADGNFLGFDSVMNSAVQMGDELSSLGPALSAALEGLPDDIKKYITGEDSGQSGSKTALSGAIKSLSEDTAGILSGQLNAIRINQIDSINIIRQQLISLNQIANNTANLDGILNSINVLVNGGRAKGFW